MRMKFPVLCMGLVIALNVVAERKISELTDMDVCRKAIADRNSSQMVRRHAFVRLLFLTRNGDEWLLKGMRDMDPGIRRKALYEYYARHGADAVPEMAGMVKDTDPEVQTLLIGCLRHCPDRKAARPLLKQLSAEMRKNAGGAPDPDSGFPFHRKNIRLQDRPDWDFEIVKVGNIALPDAGWKFQVDPEARGHLKNWFGVRFDDSKWADARIGSWTKWGYPNYEGYAWYRFAFRMPPKMECNAVELHFRSIDESAWVWLNGIYIGSYVKGSRPDFRPFWLDVTEEIKWNEKNFLTVRLFGNKGGIVKPVAVDILK